MKTVTQMAELTGISVRTLRHYDAIGLLKPTALTEGGYRLYDEAALERLYLILIYRELGFPLKEIGRILTVGDYDRNRILERQIKLLEEKRAHLQNLIHFAVGLRMIGVDDLKFENWKVGQLEDYSAQAEALYGKTEAYRESQEKAKGRTKEQERDLGQRVMAYFEKLGQMKNLAPDSEPVQAWVGELRGFFTENFYHCTREILLGLGDLYAGGGSMTENIDAAGGKGTGEFAREAIRVYCGK